MFLTRPSVSLNFFVFKLEHYFLSEFWIKKMVETFYYQYSDQAWITANKITSRATIVGLLYSVLSWHSYCTVFWVDIPIVQCSELTFNLFSTIFCPQDHRVLVYCNKNTARVLVFCGDMQLPLCNIIFPQDHRVLVYCNKKHNKSFSVLWWHAAPSL